jgi:hypothetical protein
MIRSLAAVLLMSGLVVSPTIARAQTANCAWYADTALKQQQRNEQGKCGFTGPDWSMSRQTHMTWCSTQNPDRWKAEAQKREQQLAGCKR